MQEVEGKGLISFLLSSFFFYSEAQFLCCLPSCGLLGAGIWQSSLAHLRLCDEGCLFLFSLQS